MLYCCIQDTRYRVPGLPGPAAHRCGFFIIFLTCFEPIKSKAIGIRTIIFVFLKRVYDWTFLSSSKHSFMIIEEMLLSDHARCMEEFKALLDKVAKTQRQCELTRQMMLQKISEMRSFCAESRQYLRELVDFNPAGNNSSVIDSEDNLVYQLSRAFQYPWFDTIEPTVT